MHPESLDEPQVLELRKAIDPLPHPYAIAFDLMLEAGLRVAEVTDLYWADLVHEGCVNTALRVAASSSKSHRARTIPITNRLHERIRLAWRRHMPNHFPAAADFVTATKDLGKPVSTRSLERHLRKLAEHAIGIHVNPHMLRHTFASRLLRQSNLEVVRCALGHARVSTTQRYAHTSIDDLSQAMQRVH